jgi:hypothetical protein
MDSNQCVANHYVASWLEGIIFFSLGLLTPMVSYMNLQELFAHCHIIVTWTLSKIDMHAILLLPLKMR